MSGGLYTVGYPQNQVEGPQTPSWGDPKDIHKTPPSKATKRWSITWRGALEMLCWMKSGPLFLLWQRSRKFQVYFIEFWKELLICGTYGFVFVYVCFYLFHDFFIYLHVETCVYVIFVVTAYLFVSFLSKISKSVSFVKTTLMLNNADLRITAIGRLFLQPPPWAFREWSQGESISPETRGFFVQRDSTSRLVRIKINW